MSAGLFDRINKEGIERVERVESERARHQSLDGKWWILARRSYKTVNP